MLQLRLGLATIIYLEIYVWFDVTMCARCLVPCFLSNAFEFNPTCNRVNEQLLFPGGSGRLQLFGYYTPAGSVTYIYAGSNTTMLSLLLLFSHMFMLDLSPIFLFCIFICRRILLGSILISW